MNKKSGFTLAEVLVTLMIIGVIAAMTVPSLMQSTAQQEYKAALKKSLSMMNQAITMNYALDGTDASYDDYLGTKIINLFTKRMNVMSTEGGGIYTADGIFYKAISDGSCSNASESIEEMNAASNVCAVVEVDVNGRKGPNKKTTDTAKVYDIYTFAVYPQKVLPGDSVAANVLYMK